MKKKQSTRLTIAMALLATFVAPQLSALTSTVDINNTTSDDIVIIAENDSTQQNAESKFKIDLYSDIVALHRTYGDSITLRWAINSYPEWRYLTQNGVDILRFTEMSPDFKIDTLVHGLKPLSLDQFRAAYPDESDSLAYMAMGALYGKGNLTFETTPYYTSTVGAATEVLEDQKMYLAAAFMAAERRPDIANALALRFTDRNVKKGETYRYFISPTVPDTTGNIFIHGAVLTRVTNTPYKPEPYKVALADSVCAHCEAILSWSDSKHGLFNIYRREHGEKLWIKVNDNPYAPPFEMSDSVVIFNDSVPEIGDYEYCVQAFDAFGDLTPKSKSIRVHYPDMLPPIAPEITSIIIDRPEEGSEDTRIFADIYFHKDTLERDFTHFIPMYVNPADSMAHWRLLSNQYIAPTDTMVRIDVSHVKTGMVTIAASDAAGNLGYAMPRLMRVADMRPPMPPTNLKAVSELDGTVLLTWDMQDSLDLHYYDVLYANSPDHEFVKLNDDHVYTRSYIDTIAVDANERYIYYCVRGVDWAMNQGEMSDTIQVLRPNTATPPMAHLDSMWVDDTMIHSRWVGVGNEVVSHYELYRRRENATKWELHSTYDADSVAKNDYIFQVDDKVDPDPRRGYEYAVQTVTHWGLTSGLTPVLTARLIGNRMLNFPLTIDGMYDAKKKMSKIAWNVDTSSLGDTMNKNEFYFCIWRQGPNDNGFNYITDAASDARSYVDYLLRPGESAQYRVTVRFVDGRMGPSSKIITITAPKTTSK